MVFICFAATAVWAVIGYAVNTAVSNVIARDSIDKAEHWGNYMASRVPDLKELAQSGIPTDAQEVAIQNIRRVGDIFRFNLFTSDGRLALVSDDVMIQSYKGTAENADADAKAVAESGQTIVSVFDGATKPDRPAIYSEAYVPLLDSEGTVIAVVEVYVDQTVTNAYFIENFKSFGLMLMTFCLAIFAIPSVAFFVQRTLAQQSKDDAEFLSRFDPLTGLLNRREFSEQAKRALKNKTLSVVCYLDVDHFKTINDMHGHAVGDDFLAHVADILRNNCRSQDLISRFGGDEFVICFQNTAFVDAVHRVHGILQMVGARFDVEGTPINGSASIGLAFVEDDIDLDTVLKNADVALYHAKSAGRNDFAVYGDEMGDELAKRHALEARLREAVKSNDFDIHFQPLVSANDRKTIGHEALLRLNDADGTPISPSVFVPMAEDLGLIDAMGRWTIKTAITRVAEMETDSMLAINLSTSQFTSGALVDTVRDALQSANFPADRLELEITESLLLDDSPHIEMQLDALREMGVQIAMDDFGTGFSSLSYLWKYGFDRLKIDQSFVSALDESNERSREIIESVIMLGARLNMKITAEGVETAAQAQLLSDLGCDTLQGYLFGRPQLIDAEDDAAKRLA
jgi:diguanylate cyclase (GGDEF)-like protein